MENFDSQTTSPISDQQFLVAMKHEIERLQMSGRENNKWTRMSEIVKKRYLTKDECEKASKDIKKLILETFCKADILIYRCRNYAMLEAQVQFRITEYMKNAPSTSTVSPAPSVLEFLADEKYDYGYAQVDMNDEYFPKYKSGLLARIQRVYKTILKHAYCTATVEKICEMLSANGCLDFSCDSEGPSDSIVVQFKAILTETDSSLEYHSRTILAACCRLKGVSQQPASTQPNVQQDTSSSFQVNQPQSSQDSNHTPISTSEQTQHVIPPAQPEQPFGFSQAAHLPGSAQSQPQSQPHNSGPSSNLPSGVPPDLPDNPGLSSGPPHAGVSAGGVSAGGVSAGASSGPPPPPARTRSGKRPREFDNMRVDGSMCSSRRKVKLYWLFTYFGYAKFGFTTNNEEEFVNRFTPYYGQFDFGFATINVEEHGDFGESPSVTKDQVLSKEKGLFRLFERTRVFDKAHVSAIYVWLNNASLYYLAVLSFYVRSSSGSKTLKNVVTKKSISGLSAALQR
jgi:hypothetical protein